MPRSEITDPFQSYIVRPPLSSHKTRTHACGHRYCSRARYVHSSLSTFVLQQLIRNLSCHLQHNVQQARESSYSLYPSRDPNRLSSFGTMVPKCWSTTVKCLVHCSPGRLKSVPEGSAPAPIAVLRMTSPHQASAPLW